VHWCGRDYEAASRPEARRGRLYAAGRYPPLVGRRLYSTVTAATRDRNRRKGDVCDFAVYLRAGRGTYRSYGLIGGP
jgi:hypothetical protein